MTVKGDFNKDIWLGGTNIVTGRANATYENSTVTTINATQMTSSRVLAGNDNNNVITSGSGGATLWGGAGGNDTLTGGSGQDVFWYSLGGGNDVIRNFKSGKSSACDVLAISGGGIVSMTRGTGSITLSMSDEGTLKINVGTDVDTAIKYATEFGTSSHVKIKVGNTSSDNVFTYDPNVQIYFGGTQNNTLNVTQSAEVWLDDDKYSNITELNASTSSGTNILAGDTNSNTIIGGSGSSSLWGGAENVDDLLKGGSGQNTFWYGLDEGNDTIKNAKSTDTINFYNVQLSDITSVEKTSSGWSIGISSNTLSISGNMPTANLADGSRWSYNSETETWTRT